MNLKTWEELTEAERAAVSRVVDPTYNYGVPHGYVRGDDGSLLTLRQWFDRTLIGKILI